jgi:SAM-dependent methyltransferase
MNGPTTETYTGVDNLEIMEEALNYNTFLQELVMAWARPDGTLIDFGAGTGILARPLKGAGYNVSCVERDPSLRARLIRAGLTVQASLDEIPSGSVDFIYTVNVLEHIIDDAGTVAELHERLRPGGRLLVYVPAFPILYNSMDRKVGHVRRYRYGELVGVLCRAGLQVEHATYKDCLGYSASLLFRLIGSDDGTLNRSVLIAYDRYVFPLSRRLDRWLGLWFGKNLLAVARREPRDAEHNQGGP